MLSNILTPFKACIFDFDFTLADGSDWIVECFQTILHRYGYNTVADEACRRTIGMTVENAFKLLTGSTDDDYVYKLRMEFSDICRPQMAAHTKLYPDALRFLENLHDSGCRIAIASTKRSDVIMQSLVSAGIDKWFDAVIGLNESEFPKPDPSSLFKAMEIMQCSKEETLYFGDNIIDAETAKRAGVGYIGVTTGMHTKEELSVYPHITIVDSLKELMV